MAIESINSLALKMLDAWFHDTLFNRATFRVYYLGICYIVMIFFFPFKLESVLNLVVHFLRWMGNGVIGFTSSFFPFNLLGTRKRSDCEHVSVAEDSKNTNPGLS